MTERAFWRRIKKSRGRGCHVWNGTRAGRGYGRVMWNGRMASAHRVAWELRHGPVPPGKIVCHHCDNPPCCRDDHLFIGTHLDNSHDAVAKERVRMRLTWEQVEEIRAAPRKRGVRNALALKFGVSGTTIGLIRDGVQRRIPPRHRPERVGTGWAQSGAGHRLAKLNNEIVAEMRRLHAEGVLGIEIARRFNVTAANVCFILKGRTWRTPEAGYVAAGS